MLGWIQKESEALVEDQTDEILQDKPLWFGLSGSDCRFRYHTSNSEQPQLPIYEQ